eukprot:2423844-Rhodomonas_salina.2
MSWIFDCDIHEFLGAETEVLTEDKVFEKYYWDKNSVLNECMHSCCLTHWRTSVMQNIGTILQRYMARVEIEEDSKILQELGEFKDFNEDSAYSRDVRHRGGGCTGTQEETESVSSGARGSASPQSEGHCHMDPEAGDDGDTRQGGLQVESEYGCGDDGESEVGCEDYGASNTDACSVDAGGTASDSKDENKVEVIELAVVKMHSYLQTAWKWHCSMISGGAYESEVVQHSNTILWTHAVDLCDSSRQCGRGEKTEVVDVPRRTRSIREGEKEEGRLLLVREKGRGTVEGCVSWHANEILAALRRARIVSKFALAAVKAEVAEETVERSMRSEEGRSPEPPGTQPQGGEANQGHPQNISVLVLEQ